MTRTVHLQFVVDGCEDEPMVLDSRRVQDGDHVSAYDMARVCIETAARLIVWQATRDKFGDVLREAGEVA